MDKRKAVIIGSVGMLLVAAAAWGFGLIAGTDPAISKLQQIGEQMSEQDLPEAQRDQLRDQFRQQFQSMTDDQRRSFFNANRDEQMARSQQRMEEFFAMSKADQQKRLDELLTRMTQPRDSQQVGGRDRGGTSDQGPSGSQRADNDRGGRSDRGSMTEAQREERSKRRLDHASPKMRAQYAEFRRRLDERAQQRGLKLDDRRGWRFGGPRGA